MLTRLVATLIICAAGAAHAAAERVALVIGNSSYTHQAPLSNPVNDAAKMTETLTAIGYEVTTLLDLDEDGMERALADFSELADGAEVALVYYSGHGMEISETNYLIPIDAELEKERDARFEAVDLETVRAAIEGAQKLKVVILDACRNNTFLARTRGGTRGLKRVVATAGEVIAYSTAPGSVAQDGEPGGLSPYTRALSEKLEAQPTLDVRFLFTSLGAKTAEYAGVQQRPYTEFASLLPDGRLPIGVERRGAEDGAFEKAIAEKDVAKLKELVADFPNHPRTEEALSVIGAADAARRDRLVDEALASLDKRRLRDALDAAPGHARAGEIAAALDLHGKIDAATASLELEALDGVYQATDERHPRRTEIRSALRAAVVGDACGRLLRYRMSCPPEVFALTQAPAAEKEKVAEAPASEPAREEPADPLATYVDDASGPSLAKAAAVKVEWRQVALRALGHYRGGIDGQIGPGMTRAIDGWRREIGSDRAGDLVPEEVVALMKQGAERDPQARAYLGVMYGIGLGVDLDPAAARGHLQGAERDGSADAAVYLKNLSASWKN